MFAATSKFLSIIQLTSVLASAAGIFYFGLGAQEILVAFLFYFLYSGVGVSMMLHRYWTHKTFEFKSKYLMYICSWFALMAGRGSIIGWVHVHREHHAYSDTDKDPHAPNFKGWRVFFPHLMDYGSNFKKFLVKDLFNKEQLQINKYYKLLVLFWVIFLLALSPWIFIFAWAVPIAITHLALNSFTYFGHSLGYRNHSHRDHSKNLWPFAILLWGEGWHNNHHKDPSKWNLKENWWEIDLISYVIKVVKK